MKSGRNLKSARSAFYQASVIILSLSLFVTKTEAQAIGHLGVSAEPIPLVQAKRPPRKLATRPNPASREMLADVSGIGSASGKSNSTAKQTASQGSGNGDSGSSLGAGSTGKTSGTMVAVVTPPKNQPVTPPSNPTTTTPSKPVLSPFDQSLAKAEALIGKADPRAVADGFRAALALKADSIDARLGLAEALFDAKDYAEADLEYQKVASQNPASVEARRGRADSLYELNKYEDAVVEYEGALKAGANDAGIYNNYANALFRTGKRENRDRAIENYNLAIKKQPNWPDAYAGLANVLRIQKRLGEAQQAVERSIQLAPESSLGHTVAGRVYAELQDFNRANAEGKKALELAPKDPFVHLNWAGILYMQKRYSEAINEYVAAQSYDPTWAVPRNSLGNLFLNVNRPNEALDELQIAAKLEPRSSIIHNNLGTAYLMLQKLDGAISNYQLAVQFDDRNAQAFSNMGVAYYRQGRLEEAINAFKRASELEPDNQLFKTALSDVMKKAGHGKGKDEKGKKKKG
ncbi:MAG: tetratricopeptide repeat protein [Acidobacteria bacterium]|nr:tetratricopeptide repeat protein [Acidobacteriota bacterium]